MKRDPKYFSITKHTKICSVHFTKNDFINPLAKVKRLKSTSVPSRFEWMIVKCDGEEDKVGRSALKNLEACREKEMYCFLESLNCYHERPKP